MYEKIIEFIREVFDTDEIISLHVPRFRGKEKEYLAKCIDSTMVSYVGEYVNRFESLVGNYTGSKYSIATVNGTLALHTALMLVGVKGDEDVLTPSLTFVSTPNAIVYCGANPVFIDSEKETLGMSPDVLEEYLEKNATVGEAGSCFNKLSGRRIAACLPVHVYGHPARVMKIKDICDRYSIPVVEDAAESLGSFSGGRHTGVIGDVGILSFNGNKIITTGGGGMILTDNEEYAARARHITTTAKVPHPWEYVHDEVGYNYRMPNVNAAIGCAQMENIELYVSENRELSEKYKKYFNSGEAEFIEEPVGCRSNFWINAILMDNKREKDKFLEYSHDKGVMTRPAWGLMSKLEMYKNCRRSTLQIAEDLEDRIVCLPSVGSVGNKEG